MRRRPAGAAALLPTLLLARPENGACHQNRLCTCSEAKRNPLALEYAYRVGICQGPSELGPGLETTTCQYAVHEEYNGDGKFNGAEPQVFNASTAHKFPVFDGVDHVRLPAGEVTDPWTCSEDNGCGDCDPKGSPRQCSDERGFAYLWVPHGADSSTPRILFVHGGSWLYGSPETGSCTGATFDRGTLSRRCTRALAR